MTRTRTPARTALTVLGTVGAVGVGTAVWGVGIERYLFTLRRHSLRMLPPGTAPIRLLHISDVHMAPWQHRKQRWIAALAQLRPDVIVNTGDNLGHADGIDGIRRAFAPFRGIPGMYVHGSNDLVAPAPRNPLKYFAGPSRHARRVESLDVSSLDDLLVGDLGWANLNNTAATIDVGGLRIDAFGVSDAHRDWDRLDELPAALAALGTGADLTWGVTHAPYQRILNAFIGLGAQALLAGHTHGGQVRIPFSPKALVANCDIPLDQARGLSTWTHGGRTVPLNVSAGIGHSIYAPVRFACRPEASLITLLPQRG
ncbi:metallophosphoesterase [Microbacterium kribbense]|uniref:Metallophosphoesterase n=1 Tax=Microbacterium kribbense TaxID=433645 RepID=A0ABP7GGR8_9MICO